MKRRGEEEEVFGGGRREKRGEGSEEHINIRRSSVKVVPT